MAWSYPLISPVSFGTCRSGVTPGALAFTIRSSGLRCVLDTLGVSVLNMVVPARFPLLGLCRQVVHASGHQGQKESCQA